jgi:hypothetical protein
MLYANPPIYVIDGVTVYPDHEEKEPRQFYYMPMIPRISGEMKKDTDGRTAFVPQLQLIMYTGAAGKGGFLNFDVDLGVPEDRLEKVRGKIKSLLKLKEAPLLAPVPLNDGTVTMTLFGETSGTTVSSTTAGQKKFIEKFSYPAKPALYGDNRATFSASLTESGAAMVHRLMDPASGSPGEMSPVSITYALNFLALRPAYHAHIEADWEQIQSRLADKFQYSSLIFSADIDRAVDEMLNSQDSNYLLKVDTFVLEDGNDSIIERRDAAIEELKEMITSTFFQPVANPRLEKAPDMLDRGYEKLARGAMAIASYGATEVIGCFTFKKINYKAVDTRSLNGDVSERTTVLRSINPQGHLNWAFDDLRGRGVDLTRFIKTADLDDPFFRTRTIKAVSGVDFGADSIRAIDVSLKYGNDTKSVSLASSTDSKETSWASVLKNGAMEREVTVSYTVSFKDADGRARPRVLNSAPKVTDSESVTIDPREMYSFLDVPIEAARDFPWDRYPSVRVETKYVDEAHSIQNEVVTVLDTNNKSKTWKIFQRDPLLRRLQFRVAYLGATSSQNRVTPWQETDASRIDVEDPLPRKVEKRVGVKGFDWTKTALVLVDLKYEDKENKVKKEASFEFSPQNNSGLQTFAYNPMDVPDKETVKYQVTVVNDDGSVDIPWSDTSDKVIFIRAGAKGKRRISVRMAPAAFAEPKLRQAVVKMEYRDPENDINAGETFKFSSAADEYTFDFDYVSEKKKRYRYSVEYFFSDGFSSSKDWVETAEDRLTAPAA